MAEPFEAERFNVLLHGPLNHRLDRFRAQRLALALQAVVDATGPAGAAALEDWCRKREIRDRALEAALHGREGAS